MSATLTRQALEELQKLISANKLSPIVTINELEPLASVTDEVRVDIALETVLFTLESNDIGRKGYRRTFLVNLFVAADCSTDRLILMDVVDSIESSILSDNILWEKIIDRDIVSVTYDHAEISTVRGATILMEIQVKMDNCS